MMHDKSTNTEPYPSDYHIHTPYCGHAHGKIIEYVTEALKKGMTEICFTDHLGRYYLSEYQRKRYWDWGMSNKNLDRYYHEIEDVQNMYQNTLHIRIGLEIDFIAGAEDLIPPIINRYSLDFLLGSIHCLPLFGWKHIANYSTDDVWSIYQSYFEAAKAAITSHLFNSLAHLDFIWRFSQWPDSKTDEICSSIDEIVKLAVKHDVAIEINSNGFIWSQNYQLSESDPFLFLLDAIKRHKAHITIGSDAHKPDCVGNMFNDITRVLKSKGIVQYCTYLKRKKNIVKIPDE